jgi:hypothetical protein
MHTTSEVLIPDYLKSAIKGDDGLAARASEFANQPYQAYTGERYAPFNQDQLSAFQGVRDMQGQYSDAFDSAMGLNEMAGQRAQEGFVTPESIAQYMNPYQQQVTDINKRETLRDFDQQLNDIGDAALGASAFGGDRHGVVESEARRNLTQQLADMQTQGSHTAYNQALGTALNTGIAETGAMGAAAGQQAGLAGQAQGYGLNDLAALQQIGGQQYSREQGLRDFDYGQFIEERDYPAQQMSQQASILYPLLGQSGSQMGNTTTNTPGLSNANAGLGGAALGNAFGNSLGNIFGGGYQPGVSPVLNSRSGTGPGSSFDPITWNAKTGGRVPESHMYAKGGQILKGTQAADGTQEYGIGGWLKALSPLADIVMTGGKGGAAKNALGVLAGGMGGGGGMGGFGDILGGLMGGGSGGGGAASSPAFNLPGMGVMQSPASKLAPETDSGLGLLLASLLGSEDEKEDLTGESSLASLLDSTDAVRAHAKGGAVKGYAGGGNVLGNYLRSEKAKKDALMEDPNTTTFTKLMSTLSGGEPTNFIEGTMRRTGDAVSKFVDVMSDTDAKKQARKAAKAAEDKALADGKTRAQATKERHIAENHFLAREKPDKYGYLAMTEEDRQTQGVKNRMNSIAESLGVTPLFPNKGMTAIGEEKAPAKTESQTQTPRNVSNSVPPTSRRAGPVDNSIFANASIPSLAMAANIFQSAGKSPLEALGGGLDTYIGQKQAMAAAEAEASQNEFANLVKMMNARSLQSQNDISERRLAFESEMMPLKHDKLKAEIAGLKAKSMADPVLQQAIQLEEKELEGTPANLRGDDYSFEGNVREKVNALRRLQNEGATSDTAIGSNPLGLSR